VHPVETEVHCTPRESWLCPQRTMSAEYQKPSTGTKESTPQKQGNRSCAERVVGSRKFDRLILGAVFAHLGLAAFDLIGAFASLPNRVDMSIAYIAWSELYIVEACLKIIVLRSKYFVSPTHLTDGTLSVMLLVFAVVFTPMIPTDDNDEDAGGGTSYAVLQCLVLGRAFLIWKRIVNKTNLKKLRAICTCEEGSVKPARAPSVPATLPAASDEEAEAPAPHDASGSPEKRPASHLNVQVFLDDGSWIDMSPDEIKQINFALAAGQQTFTIQARDAVYAIDFSQPGAATQTNIHTQKSRPIRLGGDSFCEIQDQEAGFQVPPEIQDPEPEPMPEAVAVPISDIQWNTGTHEPSGPPVKTLPPRVSM